MSTTAKLGMKSYPPVVKIAPAPTDAKRKGEYFVNDINSSIARLNASIAGAGKVNIAVEIAVDKDDATGQPRLRLVSADRQ